MTTSFNDDEIVQIINSKFANPEDYVPPEELPSELKDFINKLPNQFTTKADIDGYEKDTIGDKLAQWIKPLHFEENLNSAIDAAEAIETLYKEERELNLIKIQLNYFEHIFRQNELDEDDPTLTNHVQLTKALILEQHYENLLIRRSKKIIDLFQYTMAAKLGAKLLFGIGSDRTESANTLNAVSRIRESLRKLLEEYRKIQKNDQEVVIPVSLKRSRKVDMFGNDHGYLVYKWAENENARNHNHGLKYSELDFDLSKHSVIKNFPKARIRKIGVHIVDRMSTYRPPAVHEAPVDELDHFDLWSVELIDMSDGYPLGINGVHDKLKPEKVLFKSVQGNRNTAFIEWSKYDKLINMNPDRKWKITVAPISSNGTNRESIRDITLYFHLAYQKF